MSVPLDAVVLPPGLTAADFEAAMGAFTDALGDGAVLRSPEAVGEFRDPYAFASWDEHWPSAVLMPGGVEEVREVVRIAHRYRVPLWANSMGRNNAYGGGAPRVRGLIRPAVERAGLDFWPGAVLTPRSFVYVCPLLFDSSNESQVRAAFDVYRHLVKLTADAGYGLYRGHISFMDDIADAYDFGGHAMRRLQETIKDALDPGGILSPGKQGIWPRSMRTSRD